MNALARIDHADATPLAHAPAQLIDLWVSPLELAKLGRLPGLPTATTEASRKRKLNELASRERWAFKVAADGTALARTRKGKGGGLEYHVDVLPPIARAKLIDLFAPTLSEQLPAAANDARAAVWEWFSCQSLTTRKKAERNIAVVEHVTSAVAAGSTRNAATASACAQFGVSAASVGNWLQAVRGVPRCDWLPVLAPRNRGGGKAAEVDHDLWVELLSDYLRPGNVTWASSYWRVARLAAQQGKEFPMSRTLYRKMLRETDPLVRIKRREGREAHERTMPPQTREVTSLRALEWLNVDGHRWDVFVKWPNGKIIRPMMVAVQDVFSGKLLAWRFDESENVLTAKLTFGDVFRHYGIPDRVTLDNSRAFAAKPLTGGAASRFRFKVDPNEPLGLLPALGIDVRWARPYHGQAKPIERFFRDVAHSISNCPEFDGAYTGHNTMAKPENYQERAVDYETFIEVANRELNALNAKLGRRGRACNGRSFDQVFFESYAVSPIKKALPEQLRLALMTADRVRTHRNHGAITLFGNQYWSRDLALIAGTPVIVRYDPEALHSEVHVYDANERFVATVPVWDRAGFGDEAAAKKLGKARKDHRAATKKAEQANELRRAAELSVLHQVGEPGLPETRVVRPVTVSRRGSQGSAALNYLPDVAEPPLSQPKKAAGFDQLVAAHKHLRAVE